MTQIDNKKAQTLLKLAEILRKREQIDKQMADFTVNKD